MRQYIVDAFTDTLFKGNQAAVCVMGDWPTDALMQDIARENNFSETAFTVREGDGYRLRWFTPGGEIDFCGHATLGASFVLLTFYEPDATEIVFHTQVGSMVMNRRGDEFVMNFPAYVCHATDVTDAMTGRWASVRWRHTSIATFCWCFPARRTYGACGPARSGWLSSMACSLW